MISYWVWVWVLCYDRRSVGQSVLEQSIHLGPTTRYLLLFDNYVSAFVERPLWRDDGSVFCTCHWPSPAQCFLGPSPFVLLIIFYWLRFESSLYVASCNSQGVKVLDSASTRKWMNRSCLSLSLILRPTVSRPVCPGTKHTSGAYDQIFITFWQLRFCFCGTPSLTRWRVCLLYMLLALASTVLLGSESLCSHNHILLSHICDFPFRRLLRLAGSRWRYSTPSPHIYTPPVSMENVCCLSAGTETRHELNWFVGIYLRSNVC
jgi:hypothetical protein